LPAATPEIEALRKFWRDRNARNRAKRRVALVAVPAVPEESDFRE
jgi:hypothetical protein